jgi:hypothetical protein
MPVLLFSISPSRNLPSHALLIKGKTPLTATHGGIFFTPSPFPGFSPYEFLLEGTVPTFYNALTATSVRPHLRIMDSI